MAGDVTQTGTNGITATHWETATAAGANGIKKSAVNARAGEYLVYSFTATTTTKKLVANFWTGQAGMGRSSLPT